MTHPAHAKTKVDDLNKSLGNRSIEFVGTNELIADYILSAAVTVVFKHEIHLPCTHSPWQLFAIDYLQG